MLRNLTEKLGTKSPATTRGHSMAKIARLDDAFSDVVEQEVSPVAGQLLQQKDKKSRKRKGKNIHKTKTFKTRSLTGNFDFCTCLSKKVLKHDTGGKIGMLSCCKCFSE